MTPSAKLVRENYKLRNIISMLSSHILTDIEIARAVLAEHKILNTDLVLKLCNGLQCTPLVRECIGILKKESSHIGIDEIIYAGIDNDFIVHVLISEGIWKHTKDDIDRLIVMGIITPDALNLDLFDTKHLIYARDERGRLTYENFIIVTEELKRRISRMTLSELFNADFEIPNNILNSLSPMRKLVVYVFGKEKK